MGWHAGEIQHSYCSANKVLSRLNVKLIIIHLQPDDSSNPPCHERKMTHDSRQLQCPFVFDEIKEIIGDSCGMNHKSIGSFQIYPSTDISAYVDS